MRDAEAYWERVTHFRELAQGLDLKTTAVLLLLAEDYERLAREAETAANRRS
ncbi:MAG TPA: hypothetical protein VEW04_06850 [Allosphingosinicella sp.]|nr:hypothetical protein [Allosphingosinicella sp.]